MTIALGFQCTDGMVLAADSEISNAFVKMPGTKAWVYKYAGQADGSPYALQLGIVGAGNAAFIQYASERIHDAFEEFFDKRATITRPEAKSLLQGVINEIHSTHLYPAAQTAEPPSVEMVIGMWFGDRSLRLCRTYLTSVTKVWNYEAVGIGSALANFIIKRFYAGRVTIAQAVFIATEVLLHVKGNVPGCGGETQIIAMYKKGTVGFAQRKTISEHEQYVREFDDAIEPVFFGSQDPEVPDDEYSRRVDALASKLKSIRKIEQIEKQARQVKMDAISGVYTLNLGPLTLSAQGNSTASSGTSEPVPSAPPDRKSLRHGRKAQPQSQE